METTQTCEGEGSRIDAKYFKTTHAPGEEASEKGLHVQLWVRHDACVQVETVQPVVPAAGRQVSSSHRAEAAGLIIRNWKCHDLKVGGAKLKTVYKMRIMYKVRWTASVFSGNRTVLLSPNSFPPQFDFLRGCDDGGDAAGVHLQQGHLGHGVRGEEGRASGLRSLHVPAGQTQLEPRSVMWQETLTQRQADATAGKHGRVGCAQTSNIWNLIRNLWRHESHTHYLHESFQI